MSAHHRGGSLLWLTAAGIEMPSLEVDEGGRRPTNEADGAPYVTHVAFADEWLLIGKGVGEVRRISEELAKACRERALIVRDDKEQVWCADKSQPKAGCASEVRRFGLRSPLTFWARGSEARGTRPSSTGSLKLRYASVAQRPRCVRGPQGLVETVANLGGADFALGLRRLALQRRWDEARRKNPR